MKTQMPDNLVEISLGKFAGTGKYASPSMATLIAQRLHKTYQVIYPKGGYSFMTVSNHDNLELFICNSKMNQIQPGIVYQAGMLARTYKNILMPFFPELEKQEERTEQRKAKRANSK